MKKITLLTLLAIVLISCNKRIAPTQIEPVEESISDLPLNFQLAMQAGEFLDNWHSAAANADFDAYFGAIANNGVYIGTDKTEVWSKQEFAQFSKPYFDKGKAWNFKSIERNLHVGNNNEYIWFDETLDTWMGTCRGSGVVHYDKTTNAYEIEHYVLSLTVPNEKMNKVIEAIKE